MASKEAQLPPPSGGARRRIVAELLRAVAVPCALYICLQFAGLMLHVAGAAHGDAGQRPDAFGTLASVCSVLAWLVLLVGVVRLVIKLRRLIATRVDLDV